MTLKKSKYYYSGHFSPHLLRIFTFFQLPIIDKNPIPLSGHHHLSTGDTLGTLRQKPSPTSNAHPWRDHQEPSPRSLSYCVCFPLDPVNIHPDSGETKTLISPLNFSPEKGKHRTYKDTHTTTERILLAQHIEEVQLNAIHDSFSCYFGELPGHREVHWGLAANSTTAGFRLAGAAGL